jgi:hypothetical protein
MKPWESQNVSAWQETEGLNSKQNVEAKIALSFYEFSRRTAYSKEFRSLYVIL